MIENAPLISIIMNCYNGEKYLREAINSVYAQTIKIGRLYFGIMHLMILVVILLNHMIVS